MVYNCKPPIFVMSFGLSDEKRKKMKIQDRVGTKLTYTNHDGIESIGIVTGCNFTNTDWVYEIDESVYVDYSEAKETYIEIAN